MPPVVTMEGDGFARGLAYGEAVRGLIVEAAARWDAELGARADDVVHALVDESGFVDATRRLTPSFADEVEGIARSSGVDRRRVWALNLLDETWWVARTVGVGGCSVLGVEPEAGRGALVGQNMDLPAWVDGLHVLLDIRPTDGGPRVLAPAYAGIVATNAISERAIGVCVNTLSLLPTSTTGLPVAFVIRHLAAQRTLADAVAVLSALPHASGQNYLIGAPEGLADVECGAGTITTCAAEDGRIVHTNHPLGGPTPDEDGVVAGSGLRLDALRRGLRERRDIDADATKALLREPPLCRERDGRSAFTFYSAVMELGADPVLHLSDGPPSHREHARFDFSGVALDRGFERP